MKKIGYFFAAVITAAMPMLASAQTAFDGTGGVFGAFLGNILVFVNNVLVPFILGIGFLFFVWGMFQFFIAGGADEEKRANGKSVIIYTLLGFVLIIVFWGIINLVATGTGLDDTGLDVNLLPGQGVNLPTT